jgi:hypothetical protein
MYPIQACMSYVGHWPADVCLTQSGIDAFASYPSSFMINRPRALLPTSSSNPFIPPVVLLVLARFYVAISFYRVTTIYLTTCHQSSFDRRVHATSQRTLARQQCAKLFTFRIHVGTPFHARSYYQRDHGIVTCTLSNLINIHFRQA